MCVCVFFFFETQRYFSLYEPLVCVRVREGFSQTAVVERQSEMREMVLDSVCMTLAGRAAEEVLCGTISGGASSDLRVASRQLYSAITE